MKIIIRQKNELVMNNCKIIEKNSEKAAKIDENNDIVHFSFIFASPASEVSLYSDDRSSPVSFIA